MQLLNYSLISLISSLGLLVGMILAFTAKEELEPGKKYFQLLQKLTLLLIVIFLLNFFNDIQDYKEEFFDWSQKFNLEEIRELIIE